MALTIPAPRQECRGRASGGARVGVWHALGKIQPHSTPWTRHGGRRRRFRASCCACDMRGRRCLSSGKGSRAQGLGFRQQAASSKQQAAGSRQQASMPSAGTCAAASHCSEVFGVMCCGATCSRLAGLRTRQERILESYTTPSSSSSYTTQSSTATIGISIIIDTARMASASTCSLSCTCSSPLLCSQQHLPSLHHLPAAALPPATSHLHCGGMVAGAGAQSGGQRTRTCRARGRCASKRAGGAREQERRQSLPSQAS